MDKTFYTSNSKMSYLVNCEIQCSSRFLEITAFNSGIEEDSGIFDHTGKRNCCVLYGCGIRQTTGSFNNQLDFGITYICYRESEKYQCQNESSTSALLKPYLLVK